MLRSCLSTSFIEPGRADGFFASSCRRNSETLVVALRLNALMEGTGAETCMLRISLAVGAAYGGRPASSSKSTQPNE